MALVIKHAIELVKNRKLVRLVQMQLVINASVHSHYVRQQDTALLKKSGTTANYIYKNSDSFWVR